MNPLPLDFYQQSDVVKVAKLLLGKTLISEIDGHRTGGMIIETEAYGGKTDKACHAYKGRCTNRTKTMFQSGGIAYVYLCYGMHNMLNVVTNKKNNPEAVLIRALHPQIGVDIMLKRRKKKKLSSILTSGPGSLCSALGVTRKLDKHLLLKSPLWIEENKIAIKEDDIEVSKRIGIDYAKEDADLLWRFRIRRQLIEALISLDQ